MSKSVRIQIYAEAAACAVFGSFLLYTVFSGNYLLYLTPRMKPWLIFTAAVMFGWTFSAVKSGHAETRTLAPTSVFVLVIPLMLMLLPKTKQDISKLSFAGTPSFSPKYSSLPVQTKNETADTAEHTGEKYYTKLAGYDAQNRRITVRNEDFLYWVDTLYKHPFDFEGWQIEITGEVFYNDQFMNKNEFIPARLLMVCCAADLLPYGLICRFEDARNLEQGSWLTVKGTVAIGEYRGKSEPQIVTETMSAAEPVYEYIYPGF